MLNARICIALRMCTASVSKSFFDDAHVLTEPPLCREDGRIFIHLQQNFHFVIIRNLEKSFHVPVVQLTEKIAAALLPALPTKHWEERNKKRLR